MPDLGGQTYDQVISVASGSAVAYDSSGSGTGQSGPVGMRAVIHRGNAALRASPSVANEGEDRARIRLLANVSGAGGGFNIGAGFGDTRTWDFATKTLTAQRAGVARMVIVHRDFADTGNPDRIEFVVTITNLSATETVSWAWCHLMPAAEDADSSGPSIYVGAAPVAAPVHPCRLNGTTWAVISCDDADDNHAVGFSRTSIAVGVEPERDISVTFGCLESNLDYNRLTNSLALPPGASKTLTVAVEFRSTTQGIIRNYPRAAEVIRTWVNRLKLRPPVNSYTERVRDRRAVVKITSLADDPAFRTTQNPSGWRGQPGNLDARIQQAGESDAVYQARANAWAAWFIGVATTWSTYCKGINARGVIVWENEGNRAITSDNRYIGDPRWTYILAPELAYRPTVGNPLGLTVWQLFVREFTSRGLQYGVCIRGLFEETPSNQNDSGGELRALIGGVSYRYPDLPPGTTLADIASLNRSAQPDFPSHLAFCEFLLAILRYAYDEVGATMVYHDVNPKDDFRIVPGTTHKLPAASWVWVRRQLDADATRPGLAQNVLWCPEYVGPGAMIVAGGFDFTLSINEIGDRFIDDVFSYGISTAKHAYEPGGVWFINQTPLNEGEGQRREAAFIAKEIRKGSIVHNEVPPYFRSENTAAYVQAYGSFAVPPLAEPGVPVSIDLCDGISRTWCDGFPGGEHLIDWGDGTTSVVQGPALEATHTYSQAGQYTIEVTTSAGLAGYAAQYSESKVITVAGSLGGIPMATQNGTPRIIGVYDAAAPGGATVKLVLSHVPTGGAAGWDFMEFSDGTNTFLVDLNGAGPVITGRTVSIPIDFASQPVPSDLTTLTWVLSSNPGSEISVTNDAGTVVLYASGGSGSVLANSQLAAPAAPTAGDMAVNAAGTELAIFANADLLPLSGTGFFPQITLAGTSAVVTSFEVDAGNQALICQLSPPVEKDELVTLAIAAGLIETAQGASYAFAATPITNTSLYVVEYDRRSRSLRSRR